jgi:uncharacterized protein YqgV (UPF0045/DUF77 family)
VSHLSAQISLYPLRRTHLSAAINDALQHFRRRGVATCPGPMSTVVTGERHAVFRALEAAFDEAADGGEVVMVVTLSNACPGPHFPGRGRDGAPFAT